MGAKVQHVTVSALELTVLEFRLRVVGSKRWIPPGMFTLGAQSRAVRGAY